METFTHDIDGVGELRFAHLTLYDIFGDPSKPELNGFVPTYRKGIKQKLRKNLDDLDYGRDEKLSYLDGFDRAEVGLDTFLEYVSVPTSPGEVVRDAFRRANPGTEPPAIPPAAETDVVWKLLAPLGVVRKQSAATADATPPGTYGDGGEGVPENPPMPPTYSATPTAAGTSGTTATDGGTTTPRSV